MKESLVKFATFVRIIDSHDGQLSLTSLALWVVLVKIAILQQASLVDLGALTMALISYQSKKVINQNNPVDNSPLQDSVDAATAEIETLKSKVTTLALSAGLKTRN